MCDVSKKSFPNKRILIKRTNRIHPVKTARKPQLCNFCDKKLANKSNLNRHVMNKHSDEIGAPPNTNVFTCEHCKCFFSNKSSLKRHIENIHLKSADTKKSISCFQCDQRFNSIRNLNAHLKIGHNVTINEEKLQFSDLREFFTWKQEEEIRTNSRFIQLRGLRKQRRKGEEISTLKFVCNRSGIFRSKANGKRAYRLKGSSKIGRYCSAYIEITFKENDLVNGDYCSTHSGHDTDLRYLTLTMPEKREIYEKIQKGATFSSILNEIRNNVGKEIKRKHLVTNKDLHNIVTTFKRISTSTQDKTSAQSSRPDCCTEQPKPLEKNDRQFSSDLDLCADLWVETCQRMVNRFDQNEPEANVSCKDSKSKSIASGNDTAQQNSHNKAYTISYVNNHDYSLNNQPNIPHQSCYKASNYPSFESQTPQKLDNSTYFNSVAKSSDIQQVKDFCGVSEISDHLRLNKDFYPIDIVNINAGITNNTKVSSGCSAEYIATNGNHQVEDSHSYLRNINVYDKLQNNTNVMPSQDSYNSYNYADKLLSTSNPESEPRLHSPDDKNHFDMISDDISASGDESETTGDDKNKQEVPDLRDKVNSVTALYNIVESELDERKKNIIRNYVDNMFRVLQYRYNKCKTKNKQDSQDQTTNKEKKIKNKLQSTNKKQKKNEVPDLLPAHFGASSQYVPEVPDTTYTSTNSLNSSTIESSTRRTNAEFMRWDQC